MLSAKELQELRSVAIDGLSDTCAIQRRTKVRSGLDYTFVWADIATDVPCRISAQGEVGNEFEQAGSVVGQSDLILRLPFGTDISNADRVIHDGTTYNVTRVLVRSQATVTTALIGVVQ
jgi:SPP1 family predicted phage head-tail adaptor